MRSLIDGNIEALQQVLALLEDVPEHLYFAVPQEVQFGMGRHIRHILDQYRNLQTGTCTGVVDYDQRDRDSKIETDINIARSEIESIITWLSLENWVDDPLKIQTEISLSATVVVELPSTVSRELCYLANHTVHHLASIALIARLLGLNIGARIGVAPATSTYLRDQAATVGNGA